MLLTFLRTSLVLAALAATAAHAASPFASANPAAGSAARHRLQIEQQQNALDLNLQQALAARRANLSPADQRRLDQLHLQQRMEQQQLENDQLQREHLLRNGRATLPPGVQDGRLATEREIFAQERQLQLQRFEQEQQRLLGPARPQPLQPTPQPGRLNLP
jgi:hypothetical protein